MNILLISKIFPPESTARAVQIGKVVAALEKNGCQITVIAGQAHRIEKTPPIKDNIYYIPCWKISNSYRLHKRIYGKIRSELETCWIYSNWARKAILSGTNLLKSKKIDWLMSSSTPFESHIVGLKLKQISKLPWLSSFSDPWPSSIVPIPHRRKAILGLNFIQLSLLKKVLVKCDYLHMPSIYGADLTAKATGLNIKNKTKIIPHVGSDYQDIWDKSINTKGWLAHIGHLSRERASKELLFAIKKVKKIIPNKFKGLLCVGKVCSEFQDYIKELRLFESVKIIGHVSSDDAMKLACSVTALLLIEANMEISPYLPSKFADYAISKRPIIAITPNRSAVRDYLNLYGDGLAIENKKEVIARTIINLFLDHKTKLDGKKGNIVALSQQFRADKIGSQYYEIFSKQNK